MRARPRPVLTARVSATVGIVGIVVLVVLIGIVLRTTSVVWFLTFPLLLLAVLIAAAAAVLRMLQHF